MKKNLREVVLIVDSSGSMHGMERDVLGSYNSFINEQQKSNYEVSITTVLSSNSIELINDLNPVQNVKELTENEYRTRGKSSIYDAIGKTIEEVGVRLSNTLEWERPEEIIFAIITDGFDDCSKTYTYETVINMIEHQKEKYSWEFVFLINGLNKCSKFKLKSDLNKDAEMFNLFKYAEQFVLDNCPENINLSKYLNLNKTYYSMEEVSEALIFALQNRNIMPNIIKFKENKEIFKNILYDFSTTQILTHYNNEENLFDKFKEYFEIKNKESKKNLWYQYAKSVISACEFLVKFEDEIAFDNFINSFSGDLLKKAALINLMTEEISGLGISLCCEFLAELGYADFPPADSYVRELLSKLNVCKDDEYDVFKSIIKMADVAEKNAYYVYKVFYLISKGTFYLDNASMPNAKTDFINNYLKINNIFMNEAALYYKE